MGENDDEYCYNKFGFDKDGYNKWGFDKYGYDKNGYCITQYKLQISDTAKN